KVSDLSFRQNLIGFTDSTLLSPSISDQLLFVEHTGQLVGYTFDGGIKSCFGTTVVTTGIWHSAVITFKDNDKMIVYLDGAWEAEVAIGTRWAGGDRHLMGRITDDITLDEVVFYDRALTPEDVLQYHQAQFGV
ncbi:MAG: hypothetical protein OMM_13985, partial [Candidatus Magnetoglobus multicellularis str. Araruama]